MKPAGVVLRRADYIVDSIPLGMGSDLVREHHYARGGSNTATFRHGLFAQENPMECLGAALWIPPTRAAAESVSPEWQSVLALTRLVVVPGMPTNSASFLLGRSIALIRADGRYRTLLTYADEGQGHTGAIYRATNWEYLGTRPGDPVYKDGEGRQVSRKACPNTRTDAEMLALGYTNHGRTRKHKFVMRLDAA